MYEHLIELSREYRLDQPEWFDAEAARIREAMLSHAVRLVSGSYLKGHPHLMVGTNDGAAAARFAAETAPCERFQGVRYRREGRSGR